MKLHWGNSMAIVMFVFMVFILSFVYKTFTNKKYDHYLVSEDYYKDELVYQKEIDAKANLKILTGKIVLSTISEGIKINFPDEFKQEKLIGTVKIKRASTDKLDVELPIKLTANKMIIPKENLISGLWNIEISWQVEQTDYLYKEKYYY